MVKKDTKKVRKTDLKNLKHAAGGAAEYTGTAETGNKRQPHP